MKSAFGKNNIREIRHTLGRYLAILAIVALGVGFFAGLKVAKSAMVQTFNTYVTDYNMYDFKLMSTMGFVDDDVKALSDMDGVEYVRGSYSVDFVSEHGDDSGFALKAMSITENVNIPKIISGSMPKNGDECLGDSQVFTEDDIGKTVKVKRENSGDGADMLKYDEYKIVGITNSVAYANVERGTTTIGDGSLSGFVYIPEDGFESDYYTEIYITLSQKEFAFSREYNSLIDSFEDEVKKICENQADIRYDDIYSDAQEALNDAREQYSDGVAEYESEKADVEKQLSDSYDKLVSGENGIASGESEIASQTAKLDESKAEAEDGLKQLNDGLAKIDDGIRQIDDGLAQIDEGAVQIDASLLQIEDGITKAKAGIENIDGLLPFVTDENENAQLMAKRAELSETVNTLEGQKAELSAQKVGLSERKAELETQKTELSTQKADLESQKQTVLTALLQIESGYNEIKLASYKLQSSKAEIEQGWEDYYSGKAEAEQGFADAEKELYDAEKKIADGEEKLKDLESPKCYVLGREENTGYVCFDSDSSIVKGIANVFPLFFFLVAALICSTTMTRMVDDQRTQIGTLKALGFSNGAINRKYMSYSGSAALIGCVFGFAVGSKVFPMAVWQGYHLLYTFTDSIEFIFDWGLFAVSIMASILCTVGATYAACRRELSRMPAQLMRPKTPKAGKRILLERITFLWKRMKFLHKVSARNIFRYKKRLFMMILGIAGCTSLVVTGFGIKDSIGKIAEYQFVDIMKYDYAISMKDDMDRDQTEIFIEENGENFDKIAFSNAKAVDLAGKSGIKSANLISTDYESITALIDLHDKDGNGIEYPQRGEAVINTKLADFAGVKAGGTVTIKTDDVTEVSLTVSGVCENYVYNYIYISGDTYGDIYGKSLEYNTAYAGCAENKGLYEAAAKLQGEAEVANVSIIQDLRNQVDNMMTSMNYIIGLVILCAGMLAFVVLFNLSSINISERVREVATIKVLGFYPRETASYVFRENIVLTAMGALAGLPLGKLLHSFVMHQINIDMVTFQIRILPMSYIFAIILTFAFSIIVDIIMRRKLNGINMAESLKSIE